MVDDIDVSSVIFVERKIKVTMCRLNNLKKWQCAFKSCRLKNYMLAKLRHQLDFLLRVQKVKELHVVNDIGN